MGLFRKKADPIQQRRQSLNRQIADLQAEIAQLSSQLGTQDKPSPSANRPLELRQESLSRKAAEESRDLAAPVSSDSALRQQSIPSERSYERERTRERESEREIRREPVFEDVSRLKSGAASDEGSTPAHYNDLGVRKFDMVAVWNRFRTHFHGPPTTNPQLVNFLAAGSIKGLRPLRYEKRVARNRFLTFFAVLVLVLYGLIYFFLRTH